MLMSRQSAPAAGTVLVALDAALAVAAWPIALWLALPDLGSVGLLPLALFPAMSLLFFYAFGLYRREALLEPREARGRVPFAVVIGSLAASAVCALLPTWSGSDGWALLFAAAVPCFSLTGFLARGTIAAFSHRGVFQRRVVIIGAGERAYDLVMLLRKLDASGTGAKADNSPKFRPRSYSIGAIAHPAGSPVDPRLLGQVDANFSILAASDGYLTAVEQFRTDLIVVAPDDRRGLPMEKLLRCRTRLGIPVYEFLAFLEKELRRVDIKRLEMGWLLYAEGFTFGELDLWLKRALDVAAASLLLVLTAPFLLAAALAVKLEDGGPALYVQTRVTRRDKTFRIMKLRTMRTDAEKFGAVWAAERDPRITRIGNFLRRTRLDELPQLVNVLRGDMSAARAAGGHRRPGP